MYTRAENSWDLHNYRQRSDETLREYIQHFSKDAGATTAHRGSSAAAAATAASLMGADLFPLEGKISNIGQPVGHPHREYNTITTPKTCQYN
jgi:hypothetical protein